MPKTTSSYIKHSLKTDVILVNGEISPWSFKNIITLALRLGKYNWVENFISDYGPRISNIYRENAVNYNSASLFFYLKAYNKAIPLLQIVQFDELTYGFRSAKSILLLAITNWTNLIHFFLH
ncbi:MAG: hypothetical protein IPM92_06735 [Saprospiraceae bacterium]|nr:hypothetical protein [Saprospiraceae bacterium]